MGSFFDYVQAGDGAMQGQAMDPISAFPIEVRQQDTDEMVVCPSLSWKEGLR